MQRRLFTESTGRAQIGDPLRRFQRAAGRHDLAPNDGHAGTANRPRVARLQPADDFDFALRAEHRRAFQALDRAYGTGQAGALVQQRQQFQIEGVNLRTQFGEGFCHGRDLTL